MFLCTLTGHLLIKEQWKTCIVWEVLQETLNCLLNLWNHFSRFFFFFKGDKSLFREIPVRCTVSFLLPCCVTRFKNYSAKQKLWHMQIHPVVPRVNDTLKRFHAFLYRNQRAHQLSNMPVACATTTTPLKGLQLRRRSAPWRRAGSGPSSSVSTPHTWLSTRPLSQRGSNPSPPDTSYPSACSSTFLLEQL